MGGQRSALPRSSPLSSSAARFLAVSRIFVFGCVRVRACGSVQIPWYPRSTQVLRVQSTVPVLGYTGALARAGCDLAPSIARSRCFDGVLRISRPLLDGARYPLRSRCMQRRSPHLRVRSAQGADGPGADASDLAVPSRVPNMPAFGGTAPISSFSNSSRSVCVSVSTLRPCASPSGGPPS